MCPVHVEVACPPKCGALTEWRLIVEEYSKFWRVRARGIEPWDKHKHGIRAHLGMRTD